MRFKEAAQSLGAWEEPLPATPPTKAPFGQSLTQRAKEAARRMATDSLGDGFKAEALHEYRNEHGAPLFWVIRARDPKSGKKWIKQMHWTGTRIVPWLPKFQHGRKPLYGLDLLARHPGELVMVCEGEKCADRLQRLKLVAITSGGAMSGEGADWSPLAGRRVIIWPDNDEPGHRYAEDVVRRLTQIGCRTEVIDAALLGLNKAEDAVDWLIAHPGATKEAILGLPRVGGSKTVSVAVCPPDASATPMRPDLEIIARWCSERCVRDSRAWGGVKALYRDLCDWCGPDYAFAPGEFSVLLPEMGFEVNGCFAKGLLLAGDLEGMDPP